MRATTALRQAVVSTLQTSLTIGGLDLPASEWPRITLQIDGRPEPSCGQWSISVHPGPWTNRGRDHFDELHGVNVTINIRLAQAPTDQEGPLIDFADGMEELCAQIIYILHESAASVMAQANLALGANAESLNNGFIEPLLFRSVSPPQYRAGDWFGGSAEDYPAGLSRTITFADARRVIRTNP